MRIFHKYLITLIASSVIISHIVLLEKANSYKTNEKRFEARQIHKKLVKLPTFIESLNTKKLEKKKAEELVINTQPTNKVISRGGDVETPTVEQQIQNENDWDIATCTAYTSAWDECFNRDIGRTNSGVYAKANRTIASNILPMGTYVYIEKMGIYCVEDNFGGSNRASRFDIYMDTKKEAFKFGKQNLRYKVLKGIK